MVDHFQPKKEINIKRPITVAEVPQIPRYLPLDRFMEIIPEGYEDFISVSLNTIIPERPTIVLTFLNPEYKDMNTVEIPQVLFNSQEAKVDLPLFLFEHSTARRTKVDYFGVDSNYILNGPQLVYMILQHRLAHYARKADGPNGKKRKTYVNLLASDLKRLRTFVQYEAPSTYNGYRKVEYTYAVIVHRAHRHHSNLVIGESIVHGNPDETQWKRILQDLQGIVQTSSESSMHKRGKITLHPGQLYRGPGYQMSKDGKTITWICAPKQNIPARMKTHLLSDGYELLEPDTSCFQQDNLFVNGEMVNKDNTLKEAIVVYRSMDPNTKRFIAGEVEASPNIASTLVKTQRTLDITFRSESDITIEKGIEYYPDFKPYTIGIDCNEEEVKLYDIKQFTPLEIVPNGINGTYKVRIEAIMKAGNARIISQTGHKGVTKIKPYNGKIYMPPLENPTFDSIEDEGLRQYVSDKQFNTYRTVKSAQIPENWKRLTADLVMGMNAVKAKSNTIVLSQAALAVKLGYYVPTAKGKNQNYHGILNTLDVNEINDAANSLPDFIYTNEFGVPEKVFVGLAYISFTELGSVYTEFKPQSFAFESGWGIKHNSEELFKHIRENYLEEDKVGVAKDLYKILNDPKGLLYKSEKIPRYTATQIREGKMFDPRRDLFRQRTSTIKSRSKLLDPEFNPNGFYINLREQNGPMIRIPSAHTFRTFVRKLPNGEWGYHELMFNVSKIIQSILGYTEDNFDELAKMGATNDGKFKPRARFEWIFDAYKTGEKRSYQYDLYMKTVQGTLYSSEDAKQMIVQSLIKPKIPGINMKQVVEPLLPDDVVVITNLHLYKRVCRQAGHEELLNPLSITNLDIEYLRTLTIHDNKLDHQETADRVLSETPRCLAIRNPSLWESQITNPRIWNADHLEIWLKFKYNITLKRYLDSKYNRDIVLVSPTVALISHSDCDGDLLPMAVLNKEGQEMLKTFALNDMLEDEAKWNEEYWRDELKTDEDLQIDTGHKYELFTISNIFDSTGAANKNYPQFLLNACVAKGNIGPATIDIWALKAVLQWYKEYSERNGFKFVDAKGEIIDNLTHRLSEYDLKYLPYAYTRLVQEQVIEGIKHVQGGSKEFEMYFLDNITDSSTREIVQQQLEHKFKVPKSQIAKLLGIVAFAIECDDALKAIKNFITKYNKGKIPADPKALNQWEEEIQATTYFGSLVKPLFDINQEIKHQQMLKLEQQLSIGANESLSMSMEDDKQDGTDSSDLFNMDDLF